MATRRVLGNVTNYVNHGPQNGKNLANQGGKIMQVANWLSGKVNNQANKENIEPLHHESICDQKVVPKDVIHNANKRLCVEAPQPMDVDEKVIKEDIPRVPEGVIDIDKDETDANACAEYASDIYTYLKRLEVAYPIRENYLDGTHVRCNMRSLVVDWLVSVHQQFELAQETLFLSVNIMDRYLMTEVERTSRDTLQLVGATSMFIACKMEEIYLPSLEDFVYVTENSYTESEMKAMEIRILQVLQFNLNSPVSLTFLRRYSKAGDVCVMEHTLAKYILELSLMDYGQVAHPPSMTAAAALHLSLQLLGPTGNKPWNKSLQYHSGYTSSILTPIIARMAMILNNSCSHKLQAVTQKYSGRKYKRVALIREISPESIKRKVVLG